MSIDDLLEAARARLDRVEPANLAAEQAAGALVVDTRPVEQRWRDGELPGALCVDRNVLEWRLDPASTHSIDATSYDRRIIVVCNEGYSSSLAAATLRDLGLHRATDLAGGFQAWTAIRDRDRWRPSAGVNVDGRRFLRRATNSRRRTYTRDHTSIAHRAHPR